MQTSASAFSEGRPAAPVQDNAPARDHRLHAPADQALPVRRRPSPAAQPPACNPRHPPGRDHVHLHRHRAGHLLAGAFLGPIRSGRHSLRTTLARKPRRLRGGPQHAGAHCHFCHPAGLCPGRVDPVLAPPRQPPGAAFPPWSAMRWARCPRWWPCCCWAVACGSSCLTVTR